ncbi:Uracil-DNA glycosylase, family 5 [hydrothermal vent metagenome]|uniref:Type-5 uracil-DNA glycosylase n=1 Tax=hydrothermal vent metagenome TaxID=652676 RepID=A0A3B0TAJ4_9ZZZZ
MPVTQQQNLLVNADKNCQICPRLAEFRAEARQNHPDWHNGPVPVWGDSAGRLFIIGLAPGMKGANRTGRPFTGDFAGNLLFETLTRAGLSSGTYDQRPDDGFLLHGVLIANAVRCVPPQNKPTGAEIANCRPFLLAALAAHPKAKTFLALGRIAHESFITSFGLRRASFPFGHGARHDLGENRVLFDSYHCSRYNTNTRRLTAKMFEEVVFAAAQQAKIGRWR